MKGSAQYWLTTLIVAVAPIAMGADSCFEDPDPLCSAEAQNECTSTGGVFNADGCGCCRAGAHEVQACEIGLEGSFNWLACECEPNCDLADATACEDSQGVFNHVTCTCCQAGAHQIQECEMGQGGTFDWLACECDVTCQYNSDCDYGEECAGGACVESECYDTSRDGSVPALLCPDGFGCEYGDGVDYNHGNGYCVEIPCTYNSDCRFGFECRGRLCVESDCHSASPDGSMDVRECPDGFGCEYGDGVDYNHGNGHCYELPGSQPDSRTGSDG